MDQTGSNRTGNQHSDIVSGIAQQFAETPKQASNGLDQLIKQAQAIAGQSQPTPAEMLSGIVKTAQLGLGPGKGRGMGAGRGMGQGMGFKNRMRGGGMPMNDLPDRIGEPEPEGECPAEEIQTMLAEALVTACGHDAEKAKQLIEEVGNLEGSFPDEIEADSGLDEEEEIEDQMM